MTESKDVFRYRQLNLSRKEKSKLKKNKIFFIINGRMLKQLDLMLIVPKNWKQELDDFRRRARNTRQTRQIPLKRFGSEII